MIDAQGLPAHLAAHIRTCLAKTPHHTPAIELNRAGWEAILSVLDDAAAPDPWKRPAKPDTPELAALREALRAAKATATAEARETLAIGDRITRELCGGGRGTFTLTNWDGDWMHGRTVSDCHAVNVIAVNGQPRRFGDWAEIDRARAAFFLAQDAENAARLAERPPPGGYPTDDPVPF